MAALTVVWKDMMLAALMVRNRVALMGETMDPEMAE